MQAARDSQGKFVNAIAIRLLERLALALLSIPMLAALVSCSGAVTDNSSTGSTAITISPSNATLYSDLPTTFVLSGGNGTYVVTSSNQAVIAFTGTVNAHQLTVIPSAG